MKIKSKYFYLYHPLYVIFCPHHSTLCHVLKSDKLWKEGMLRGEIFLHELLLNHITLYQKKQKRLKIEDFEQIGAAIFTHRHTCINKPCWQSGEITILLYCLKLTV